MKNLLFILAAICLATSWSFAQENRIDPPRNIKQAPGANYVLLSDGPGNFQIVPAASLPGGGGGDVITNFTYNGSALTITTDQDVFSVNVNAGTVETTVPISINGTAYPSGTDIQVILGAIGTAIDNIGLVDNGDGTYTFTDTDGSTVTINTGGGGATVIASNGLNDQDGTSDVDVELGGTLDKNTDVTNTNYRLRFGSFTGLERSYLEQNALSNSVSGFTYEEQTGGGAVEEAGFTYSPGFFQLETDSYASFGGALQRLMRIDASLTNSVLGISHVATFDTMEIRMADARFDIFASNGLDLDSKTGITLYDGRYGFPDATPGAGQKVVVWNSGTPSFEYYGGGESVVADTYSIGNFDADVTTIGGTFTIVTNPSAGKYDFDIATGAHVDGIRIYGNNTTLNANQEMVIEIDNVLNSGAQTFLVQLYDANNGAVVNQQVTATVHTQIVSGPVTTITIPGLNGFGATGFYVELR